MIGRFDIALAFILRPSFDGQPLHVSANDAGGATSMGITLPFLSDFLQRQATIDDLRNMTPATIAGAYKKTWNYLSGDYLPTGIDSVCMDFAVLAGAPTSAALLQKLVGVKPDFNIGPKTMAAVRSTDARDLLMMLGVHQAAHHAQAPNFNLFGNGWLHRTAVCVKEADADALAAVPINAKTGVVS